MGNSMKFAGILVLMALQLGCTGESEPQWYKGNLHTHSYWSDGDNYPEMIMKWYKEQGYDFVALSDHNILAEGEKWIEVEKGSAYDATFQQYLGSYDSTWVDFEELDRNYRVRLKTLEEYRPLFEEEEAFLIIRSEEITDRFDNKPVHVNATNIQELIEPQGGNSVADVMQNNINAVLEQRESTGEPMFPHINHPNFGWAVTTEDLKKLEGEQFFEVYNGHPRVHNYGDSLRSGTEQMWDEVITHYLLEGRPVMYGIAVDDAHNYHDFDSNHSNPGRGWVYVKSHALTPDALIAAMERGDFYSSSGVQLNEIRFDGTTLSVDINQEEGVAYSTRFIGTRVSPANETDPETGVVLETVEGPSPTYTFSGDELYVRAKIVSDKMKRNPYSEGEVETAWTQPVFSQGR